MRRCVCAVQVTLNPKFHVVDPATGIAMPILGSIQLDVDDMIYRNLVVRGGGGGGGGAGGGVVDTSPN